MDLIQVEIDSNTFEKVAREWHEYKKSDWSENHANHLLRRLVLDVFDFIGEKPIVAIERPELVNILQRIATRSPETAIRIKIAFYGIFRYAHNKGMIKLNSAIEFRDVIPKVTVTHMAAPTVPKKVAELMKAIDGFTGSFVTMNALKLTPLFFVRPGELRSMEWSELNLDSAEWNSQFCFELCVGVRKRYTVWIIGVADLTFNQVVASPTLARLTKHPRDLGNLLESLFVSLVHTVLICFALCELFFLTTSLVSNNYSLTRL